MGWGFVAPALLILLAMNLFPLIFNIYLSFTNADLSGGVVRTVGARNYTVLFAEARYANALTLTALFVALSVATELVLGFVLALALRDHVPGKPVILTVLLIPMMLCPVVLSLFWNLILNANYGVLNQLLASLRLPQPQWLTDDRLKLVSILLVDVWMWTPFMMLIMLAGLQSQPSDILEAAVFGIPSEEWGEAVHAVVVPREGHVLLPDQIIAFARAHLAGYKVPRSVELLDELPKTGSGKILKRELRAPHWAGRTSKV